MDYFRPMKRFHLACISFLLFPIISCNSKSEFEIIPAHVTQISCQTSAVSGQSVPIDITIELQAGCEAPFNVVPHQVGQTIELEVLVKKEAELTCTGNTTSAQVKYTFYADQGGVYFFKPINNQHIADTLQVF